MFLSRREFPSVFLPKLTFTSTHPVAEDVGREINLSVREDKVSLKIPFSVWEEADFLPSVFIFKIILFH